MRLEFSKSYLEVIEAKQRLRAVGVAVDEWSGGLDIYFKASQRAAVEKICQGLNADLNEKTGYIYFNQGEA
jgi:hypothetical protein